MNRKRAQGEGKGEGKYIIYLCSSSNVWICLMCVVMSLIDKYLLSTLIERTISNIYGNIIKCLAYNWYECQNFSNYVPRFHI